MRCYVLTPAPETTQSGTEATASQQHYYLSVSLEPAPRTMRGPRDNPCPRPPAVAPAPRVPFPEPLEAALCEPDPFLPRQIPLCPLPQLPARRDSVIDGLEARSPSFTTTPAPIATARNAPCPSNRGNPRQIRPANLINLPPPSRPPSRPPPQVPPPRIPSNPDLLHVGSAFVPAHAIPAQHHQHHQQQHHHHHRRQSTQQQQRPQPQRLHIAAVCPRCDGTGTTARRGSTTRAPVPPPISPTATVITRPPPNCTCSSFPALFPFPAPPTPNGTAAAARAYNNNSSLTSPTTTSPTTAARAPTTTTTTATRHPHTNGTRVGRHVLPNGVSNNNMTNGTILSPTTTTSMRTGPPPRPPHRRGAFSFSSGEGVRAAARAAALGLPFPYGALDGVANGLGGNGDSTGRSVGYGIDPVGGGGEYQSQSPARRATVAHVVAPRAPAPEAEAYEPDSEDEEAVDLVEIVDLVSSSSQPVSAFDFDSDSDEDESNESDEDEDDEDEGEKSDDGELDDDNKSDSSSESEFEFDMSGEEDGLVEMKVVLI